MRSLIAPKFTDPSGFTVLEAADPTISKPTEVLIAVHAASINPHDVIMASGQTKLVQVLPLPYPLGLDFAGEVLAVGSAVSSVSAGDRVYGFSASGGAASTHLVLDTAKSPALARLPAGLDMAAAASWAG